MISNSASGLSYSKFCVKSPFGVGCYNLPQYICNVLNYAVFCLDSQLQNVICLQIIWFVYVRYWSTISKMPRN